MKIEDILKSQFVGIKNVNQTFTDNDSVFIIDYTYISKIAVTGDCKISRTEIKLFLSCFDVKLCSDVTSNVDLLIANDTSKTTTKLVDAKRLKKPICTDEYFFTNFDKSMKNIPVVYINKIHGNISLFKTIDQLYGTTFVKKVDKLLGIV